LLKASTALAEALLYPNVQLPTVQHLSQLRRQPIERLLGSPGLQIKATEAETHSPNQDPAAQSLEESYINLLKQVKANALDKEGVGKDG